ncbi:hypothetical protein [Escherichia coli]|uniref:hypothetical protein n=1 Tax=Escherichia coli TaxID=562 RepID=UPI000DF342B9|nr:hypothetical protein [Escherichia coli]
MFDKVNVAVVYVLLSSWVYEQTNFNFYQVISVHDKQTVTVQEIRASVHRTHSMSGYKTPLLNDFCGEPLKRRVRDYYSKPAIEIESFETAYKGSPEEKHEFTSYY